jgi:hypothetical protein
MVMDLLIGFCLLCAYIVLYAQERTLERFERKLTAVRAENQALARRVNPTRPPWMQP